MSVIRAGFGRALLSGGGYLHALRLLEGRHWRAIGSSCRHFSVGPYPWDVIERRCRRLESFRKRLIRPPCQSFVVDGKVYSLPVRAQDPSGDSEHAQNSVLDYFAGFFDGDGCVSSSRSFGNRSLQMYQAENNVAVLVRFMKQFGGGIYKGSSVKGSHQCCFRWELSGERARGAASLLRRASVVKREQLDLLVSEAPTCPLHRGRLASTLRSLKREAPGPCHDVSWGYVAGFFDAEGCIQIKPYTQVHLKVSQKYEEPLICIKRLIERTFPGVDASLVQNRSGHYQLCVSRTASSFAVLEQLLNSGLAGKKQQAILAMSLNRSNFARIRDSLSELKGNQSRWKLLDAAGCERAMHIHNARTRLNSRAGQDRPDSDFASLQGELYTLNSEHKLRNAERRLAMLRWDIRSLLRQGARLSAG
ncbi:unnamed protein product [Prorocentrum cordatum]|uniref:LAGLIDADG endonuclease n=1 Tax=Prorocentrum cordatum TaxID=2364126 RepID=A0ABN9W802_9DINO|nr:unnamed protein product [Polarella glacialis]